MIGCHSRMWRFRDISITKKLFIIMAIMAILITTELVALSYAIKVFSAVRAYVGGEGLWSKAQKNAAYFLVKYSNTHNEKDYQNYLDYLKVPSSDHQARLALSKNPVDYEAARQGFLGGRIHPDDINGIIWLFSTFHSVHYIDKAIRVWSKADDLMTQFRQKGEALHQSIQTHTATPMNIATQLIDIDKLNNELTTVEDEFSYTLGQASRWLENLILKLLLSTAITVEFTGIFFTTMIGLEISRNINAMNKVAKKIANSDYSERINVPSKDEIGQLAISFNAMIDELDRSAERKSRLEEKFKSILEGAPDAMVITNKDGVIVMINAQTEKIFGYTKQEIIGKHVECLVPERYRHKHVDHRTHYFINPHPREMGVGLDLYGLRKNGHEFPVEISLSPVETEEGILALAAIRDITDKKQNELALIEKNIELENANLAKDQFLSHMSHELRTPLNGIITMTQLLSTSPLSDDQKDKLDIISESEDQLLFVINQILDFSKVKYGNIEVEKIVFNLRELIKKILAVYEVKAKLKKINLTCNIDENISELYIGDKVKILQALSNILDNAIKFTNNGKIDVNVTTHKKNDNTTIILFEVTDTGIGITSQNRSRLFEPFSQGDYSMTRRYGGTGLGLAISKGLIEAMGGMIDVESSEHGSRFYFTVPLIESRTLFDTKHTSYTETTKAIESPKKNIRILLAEDNKLSQKTLKVILENYGYQISIVSDGLEVLEELKKSNYDLILMDCQMPNMDGYATTKKIRENELSGDKKIPIIGVTAHAMENDRKKCLDAGMSDYISKPFNIVELYNLIRNYVKK